MTPTDENHMARALELAMVPPHTSPNPRVGAVLVRDDQVIAEGAHQGAGTRHAEAVALDGVDAAAATLYVNLEPCSHHGRMPPCAPVVAASGVRRVVVGQLDPDPRVSGRGIEHLRGAGLEVEVGVLEDRASWINAPFLHHRRTGRSFLTLKMALTLDGRLAAQDGSSRWITGEATRRYVHARRLEADAVMVGSGTVVADNPLLDVRDVPADRQPIAVVVDSTGTVTPSARIFDRDNVIVVTSDRAPHDRQVEWKAAGAEVVALSGPGGHVDLAALLGELGRRDVVEVFCEGGAGLASALLRVDLVDRLEIHTGPVMTGAGPSIGSLDVSSMDAALKWELMETRPSEGDVISVYRRVR